MDVCPGPGVLGGGACSRHEPGFMAVLAYTDGHPVGYDYGNTIEHGDRYWQRTSPRRRKYTAHPILAPKEIGARPAWRKAGTPDWFFPAATPLQSTTGKHVLGQKPVVSPVSVLWTTSSCSRPRRGKTSWRWPGRRSAL
ncbi:hypothetical protein [Streptomyces sp. NBC_01669]|uniref:hypothetical protein n=1 Tax=Streptomyces sp. NBC_01669 TaxID=2975909 RepID=UPI00225608B1|nr:hypothetical protein [Streptomyces sp. NBC_01669]MCX4534533.1 hypothetical protein [Streptomyces sp. NBC_01669]